MTPKAYYEAAIARGEIREDQQQRPVIDLLDNIYQALQTTPVKKSWFSRTKKCPPVKGLYLWGSVGIGKTFLMDCFYHTIDTPKMRMHFHQFMRRIHEELKAHQGQKNPLSVIAQSIAKTATVICFDEFFVSDIADAMILGELFTHLFENGITLITSSNIPPDLLYKEGLQRERFLPAIDLIKKNTNIVHLYSTMDYRRQHICNTGVFYTPLDATSKKNMENAFAHFSNGADVFYNPIEICQREISIIKRANNVIWFDFEVICGRPRSQMDYLSITEQYHTLLVQNLRPFEKNESDLVLSFIYLVDILYDAHCRLIISSSVDMNKIYTNIDKKFPFDRTLSRLIEMQSESYVYPEKEKNFITDL